MKQIPFFSIDILLIFIAIEPNVIWDGITPATKDGFTPALSIINGNITAV